MAGSSTTCCRGSKSEAELWGRCWRVFLRVRRAFASESKQFPPSLSSLSLSTTTNAPPPQHVKISSSFYPRPPHFLPHTLFSTPSPYHLCPKHRAVVNSSAPSPVRYLPSYSTSSRSFVTAADSVLRQRKTLPPLRVTDANKVASLFTHAFLPPTPPSSSHHLPPPAAPTACTSHFASLRRPLLELASFSPSSQPR